MNILSSASKRQKGLVLFFSVVGFAVVMFTVSLALAPVLRSQDRQENDRYLTGVERALAESGIHKSLADLRAGGQLQPEGRGTLETGNFVIKVSPLDNTRWQIESYAQPKQAGRATVFMRVVVARQGEKLSIQNWSEGRNYEYGKN